MAAKRQYTPEFKLRAAQLAQAMGLGDAARQLAIPQSTLANWLKRNNGATAGDAKPLASTKAAAATKATAATTRADIDRAHLRQELASTQHQCDTLRQEAARQAAELQGQLAHAAVTLGLYARMLAATSLAAAAHDLVATLAQGGAFDRVSIALHQSGRTRLLASTDLDPSNTQAELAQLVLGAMDEAIDQGDILAYPRAQADAAAHGQWITLAQQLLQRQVGGAVASLPLGFDGQNFAAVCVERHQGPGIGADTLQTLAQRLALAAPALRWMQLSELSWHQRARRAWDRTRERLRQPERRGLRFALLGACLLLAFATLVPLPLAVGGRARVEGAQQRVMSAPSDGFIKTAHVRPGDRVKAGAALVDLIEEDLQLEHERWSSQLAQHENAYAASMAKSDRVGASTSFARVSEAQAQLALIEQQRTRGRIAAPFDALVVQGDLSQSIGAPVRQGDTLLTLATTDQFRVVVDIDESDIARIQPGQSGTLALSSLPWQDQALVVERITPLARAVEGRNVFEVQARLLDASEQLRPGLVGRADVVVGRLPLLWGWGRQAINRLRLAWWSWLG